MSYSLNAFILCTITIAIGLIFFYLANKLNKKYTGYLVAGGFYFLLLSFFSLLVAISYAYVSPDVCEWVINDTHTVENASSHGQYGEAHTDTDYFYVSTCSDVSTSGMENLYVIYAWTFYMICGAIIIYLWYLTYRTIKGFFSK